VEYERLTHPEALVEAKRLGHKAGEYKDFPDALDLAWSISEWNDFYRVIPVEWNVDVILAFAKGYYDEEKDTE
jgi:hypothetical protein